jgi:putative heme degradation protein
MTSHNEKRIQAYLTEHPGTRAIDVATAVGCTEAEALAFLSDEVWRLNAATLDATLTLVQQWETVMVLVRNADAVAELTVPGQAAYRHGDWLNWIVEPYNLHIRVAATIQILGLVRPGKRGPTYSFNLINETGQVFCRFYTRTVADSKKFLEFCRENT